MSARKSRLLDRLDRIIYPLTVPTINRGLREWLVGPPRVEAADLSEEDQARFAVFTDPEEGNGCGGF